jgi:hypothetical protein
MVLIVGSILLAFSLESWRDDRRASERQIEVRETIRADFINMLPGLQGMIEDGDSLVARAGRLLEGLAAPHAAGADSLQALFAATMRPVGRPPVPPSYRAAMSSGELRTLDDPELMTALALVEFSDQMLAEHMRVSADIFYTGPVAQVSARLGGMQVLAGTAGAPSRFTASDYLEAVSAPDVYSAAERMMIVNRNLLFGLRQLDAAMVGVVTALSPE